MKLIIEMKDILLSLIGLPTITVMVSTDPFFQQIDQIWIYIFWILIGLAILISSVQLLSLVYNPSIKICKNEDQINKEMLKITKKSGNTCILSRNMSWANAGVVMDALIEKAQGGDLTLFVNEKNDNVSRLNDVGANVFVYKGEIPKCRFTIKNYKGAHSHLYIAKVNSPSKHVIHHHTDKNDVTLKLAEDLVRTLEGRS